MSKTFSAETFIKEHADFSKYYDNRYDRNIWALGYFGGGALNIYEAMEVAKIYAKENNVPLESVKVDEIFRSRRFQGFKVMYSTERQPPAPDSVQMDNVWQWLTD